MKCTEVRQLLDWFADGELDPRREAAVRGHLGSCERCSEELGLVRCGIRLTQSLPEEAPPPGLRREILARTTSRRAPARSGWASWPARVAMGFSFAAAAAAVVFAVVLPSLRGPAPEKASASDSGVKAVAHERGTQEAVEPLCVAAESAPLAGSAHVRPASQSSSRADTGRALAPPGEAGEPGAASSAAGVAPEGVLEETEWSEGADEMVADGVIFGPELATVDEPVGTAPLGEATRIAIERSVESDLVAKPSGTLSSDPTVLADLDAEELTADLIREINERLASAKPKAPVRRLRLEPGQRGGVEVPLVHGNFR